MLIKYLQLFQMALEEYQNNNHNMSKNLWKKLYKFQFEWKKWRKHYKFQQSR